MVPEVTWLEDGYEGPDLFIGDDEDNTFDGLREDDEIYRRWGADTLTGGNGADFLYGGREDDRLVTDPRFDFLDGGSGPPTSQSCEAWDNREDEPLRWAAVGAASWRSGRRSRAPFMAENHDESDKRR